MVSRRGVVACGSGLMRFRVMSSIRRRLSAQVGLGFGLGARQAGEWVKGLLFSPSGSTCRIRRDMRDLFQSLVWLFIILLAVLLLQPLIF